jgi:terminase small subunit-like protein
VTEVSSGSQWSIGFHTGQLEISQNGDLMPRGGKRLGSGRKPHTRTQRWLGGNASKVNLALVTHRPDVQAGPAVPVEVPDVPAILTEDEGAYWRLYAPLAVARGMLNQETQPGLVQLCQVARRAAAFWAEIESRGFVHETTIVSGDGQERYELKRHPLISDWRGLVQRQEQMLARFGLTADGKIAGEPKEKPDAEKDELAKLMAVR